MRHYDGPRKEHQPLANIAGYGMDDTVNSARYLREFRPEIVDDSLRLDDNWSYSFNSFGYRGEEPDPQADFRIFAVGCSYTFGTGVKWEQTWSYRFKMQLQDYLGLGRVNLLNFSQGGASNDYIARTAILQASDSRPDLLLVLFTFRGRKEHLQSNGLIHLGAWNEGEIGDLFYLYYSDEDGLLNTLKNMLLVQFFCSSNDIPYLFGWIQHPTLGELGVVSNPILSPLIDLLDQRRFFRSAITDDDILCDVARDCTHPGPRSHRRFADLLFGYYQRVSG